MRYIWVGEGIVPEPDAKVSVFDAGFQSGDAVWEGLRVYRGRPFRLREHLQRLEASAKALRIRLPRDAAGIEEAIVEVLEANNMTDDVHIRLMVTRGTRSTSGMSPATAPPQGTLVIIPERKPVAESPTPERLRTSSIRRPTPAVLDPGIHHANQLNSILARLEVMDDAAVDAALMLDADGFVAEADTANLFCVTGKVLRTPPATACLHGITRAIVLELGSMLGLNVAVEPLTLFDLYSADEVFLTGTICELVPVVSIDNREIGTGAPGPVWRELLDAYREHVRDDVTSHHEGTSDHD